MKKIYILALSVLPLAFSSCSGFLDKMPSDSLGEDISITSVKDIRLAINGVSYLMSEDRMTYSADFAIYADLLGGDFQPLSDNNQSGPISRYQLNPLDQIPNDGYMYFYKAIANVNSAIEKSRKLTVADSEKAQYSEYLGQLYAWRAMLHFDLARMFCDAPTASDNIEAENSGLVLSTQVYLPSHVAGRSTLKATYEQILADFEEALELMSPEAEKENGYLNYHSALALRSRVNLYYGEYADALADAKGVIAEGGYELYTADEYTKVWFEEFTDESIFEMKISSMYNAQRNSSGYYTSGAGYGECAFDTDTELYKYLSDDTKGDIRSELVVFHKKGDKVTGGDVNFEGYYPAKYPGREGSIYVNNPKVIRLSDVYLIAAECEVHLGNSSAAAKYVNDIRANRIEGYAGVASVTLDEVLFERRVELFAENSFAFDMWRNKKSIVNFGGKEITHEDYSTVMPIPQREIDKAQGLLKQNQGW